MRCGAGFVCFHCKDHGDGYGLVGVFDDEWYDEFGVEEIVSIGEWYLDFVMLMWFLGGIVGNISLPTGTEYLQHTSKKWWSKTPRICIYSAKIICFVTAQLLIVSESIICVSC